ncbi:Aste57867_2222 [Aphanomyces stellatus]|uniref:Aste57867_2222 protein n=1 Tax=Aphanomyces stellatus TaxID=120398 RepID=A0A485KCR1_9STRA|nr:hypothetical protein As57867_002217 [Aphanomyces stellatus]VFT79425.1 Aste57867_2222 [Aphanomyces stellatus]
MKKTARLKAKSSYVKPLLTEANRIARLAFAKSFLRPSLNGHHVFVNMYDQVHVDEKWFFLTKVKRRIYVYADEEVATRAVQSNSFITKVMFLAAVARPYDYRTRKFFDGKLGVWPFVKVEPAEQSRKNRPRGTLITSPQNVTGEVYREMILRKVIPSIKANLPGARSREIVLQQDNAGPHSQMTTQFLKSQGVRGVVVAPQPPNSPDFNVLDLGFFHSIQSLQHHKRTRNIEELVGAVGEALFEFPVETLSKTFITLQKVMETSISIRGGNEFKLPHMKKDSTISDLSTFNVEFLLNE